MSSKFKQIARLKSKCISNRKIAESLEISRNYVNLIVKKMIATNLTFQEFGSMEETEIEKLLNFEKISKRDSSYVMPNYEKLTKEVLVPFLLQWICVFS